MSVENPLDIHVDLDDGSARVIVTERRELEIDDLFRDGELRLWEDDFGWTATFARRSTTRPSTTG